MPRKTPKKTPKKKRAKADTAEAAKRVDEVLRIRLDGAQFHDIVQYAAEKGWGLKDRQIRTYIQRADALLVERQDKSRKQVIARHLAQRQALYARAVNAADYRTALAILADDAKLRGLYTSDSEFKELCKLAAEQGRRIQELEGRLDATQRTAVTDPGERPTAGAAGRGQPGATAPA
jgi:hypothetical protein